MSKKLQQLREERNRIVTEARAILDKAEAETRDLSDEERGKWDELIGKQTKIGDDISREEKQIEAERAIAAAVLDHGDAGDKPASREDEVWEGVRSYFKGDRPNDAFMEAHKRALQADSDIQGGYTVMPQEFVNRLIKAIDDQVFIRQRATTMTLTSAQSLGAPSLDADPADSDWTHELSTGSEDSAMKFGKRELTPWPLAKRLKVSNTLLRRSAQPIENLVIERLSYKFGITQEKAFLTGSGAGQPLGVFTASTKGISTGRDVSEGNTTTSPQFDGLVEAKYSLKGGYWPGAAWMFHRDALKRIAKLKDGEGQYLWQPSRQAGEADRLLGLPFLMSEYVPNTFTTGLYVGILADWSYYWIADALTMQMQRLVELYAESNQTGFIGRLETDGMPVLEEAFVRVKLA